MPYFQLHVSKFSLKGTTGRSQTKENAKVHSWYLRSGLPCQPSLTLPLRTSSRKRSTSLQVLIYHRYISSLLPNMLKLIYNSAFFNCISCTQKNSSGFILEMRCLDHVKSRSSACQATWTEWMEVCREEKARCSCLMGRTSGGMRTLLQDCNMQELIRKCKAL